MDWSDRDESVWVGGASAGKERAPVQVGTGHPCWEGQGTHVGRISICYSNDKVCTF